MNVREILPTLERSAALHRRLDAIIQAHLVDDVEMLDTLITQTDLAELRGVAVELETVVLRHSLSLVGTSPPEPAAASPLDRGRLVPLDPYSRNA